VGLAGLSLTRCQNPNPTGSKGGGEPCRSFSRQQRSLQVLPSETAIQGNVQAEDCVP